MIGMNHGLVFSLFLVPGGYGSPLKSPLKRPKWPELGVSRQLILIILKNEVFSLEAFSNKKAIQLIFHTQD